MNCRQRAFTRNHLVSHAADRLDVLFSLLRELQCDALNVEVGQFGPALKLHMAVQSVLYFHRQNFADITVAFRDNEFEEADVFGI